MSLSRCRTWSSETLWVDAFIRAHVQLASDFTSVFMAREGQDQISNEEMQETSLSSALSWHRCLGRPMADSREVWGVFEVRMQEMFSFLCWPLFPEYFPGMYCASVSFRAPMHMDRGCKISPPSCLESIILYLSRTQL